MIDQKLWEMFVSWYETNIATKDTPQNILAAWNAFEAGYNHKRIGEALNGRYNGSKS